MGPRLHAVSVLKTMWRRRPLLALIVLILLLAAGYAGRAITSHSKSPSAVSSSSPTVTAAGSVGVPLSTLPPEAAKTVMLIEKKGPFPYPHDGIVYQNLEHHLPAEPRGYYHEYTVTTPGSADRGTRRIITGNRGEFWYTDDHYQSFVRVDISR